MIVQQTTHRVRRLVGTAAAVLAITLSVAACGGPAGSSGPDVAGQSSPASTIHSGHGSSTASPSAAPLRTGERFQTIAMPQPYTPSAPNGGTDEYRCFLIDPKLTTAAYLTGSQFIPQNTAIVHHAIFYRISPADAPAARSLDASTPGEGWTCFGSSGVGGQQAWVASWAPGVKETLLAPNLGYPMPPGSLLVMQVHYNLLATGGKPAGNDQSSMRLRLHDATASMTALQTKLLEAPVELPCTASESGPLCNRAAAVADVTKRFGEEVGATENALVARCENGNPPAAGPTQHCDYPVGNAGTVYALGGHMHLLGRSIKIELNPGTARAQTLLDVPVYNFDNQAIQPLAKPQVVKPGDVLRVTCTHDAALRKLVPQLQAVPPRYVVWGDGTSDEMCLGLVAWSPTR
jgi:hypothetical protein